MSCAEPGRKWEILMVDDNPGDARLTVEALKEVGLPHHFQWMEDGEEALRYLRRQGDHAGAVRPDLILLDLNLPRTDGREVLTAIKGDPALQTIPVIILTTSQAEEDISRSYYLSANCYIRKPITMDQFITVLGAVKRYWLGMAQLPLPSQEAVP